MGKPAKNQKAEATAQGVAAVSSSPVTESKPRQGGRRIILKFIGGDHPELDRIECRWSAESQPAYWQQGDPENPLSWREVAQALSLIFLDYLAAGESTIGPTFFSGARKGSLAASLGAVISDSSTRLHSLLIERLPKGSLVSRVEQVFAGVNVHGKDKENDERRIFVRSEFLPQDCIEIYWTLQGRDRITERGVFRDLARRIRETLGIPVEPEPPVGEGSPPEPTVADPPPTPKGPVPQQEELPGIIPDQLPSFPELRAVADRIAAALAEGKTAQEIWLLLKSEGVLTTIDRLQAFCQALTTARGGESAPQPRESRPPPEPSRKLTPPEEAEELAPDVVYEFKKSSEREAEPEPEEQADEEPPLELVPPAPEIPFQPIDPRLFEVAREAAVWRDDAVLVSFGEDAPWTVRNAFEGTLVLGATGSGKTSGSGVAIAHSFLHSGFGGLVLTAKAGEADHWERLCAKFGRCDDVIRVSRGGPWKLNILSYEAQRPGPGGGLAENLVAFARNLLKVSIRQQGMSTGNDDFWQKASDQLLHATFDLFLLAGSPVTFDALADFIAAAPTELPADNREWLNRPPFSELVSKARQAARTDEDKRILRRALDYWLRIYPGLAGKTRTSITIGVYAMLDAFRGRDIPALISSDTNITPESIMSGNIVILDLPVKEFGHTGLLIQSAWKYLFQTALERQGNAGDPRRRPVFLWEDEAQYFVSDHDHHFQDTARSSRACRVLLSQNLHSFYREFGRDGTEAANSAFGNLNTKIFHANSDPATNEWAAKQFGQRIFSRQSVSHAPPPPAKDIWDSLRQTIDPPNTTTVGTSERLEYAVKPEEFAQLRNGGPDNDFLVDAYVTWIGLCTADTGEHFTKATFIQDQDL